MLSPSNVLKPSQTLKESWRQDCSKYCSVYWASMKAMPYVRYDICMKKCIQQKRRKAVECVHSYK